MGGVKLDTESEMLSNVGDSMIIHTNQCTGCGSCAVSCPVHCIEMQSDREGFRQPVVDQKKCIDCSRCEAACPLISRRPVNDYPEAFAVKSKDNAVRTKSSSGGVFSALAQQILSDGGVVCAASYGKDFSVIHKIVYSMEELDTLRGAKYAQSVAEDCFPKILKLLKRERQVLFVGTPCQCAGLHAFLGRTYANLVLVDMVCHGVPSPAVWQRYLAERSQIDAGGSAVCAVNQRSKRTGWSRYSYSVCLTYENGAQYCVPQGQDWYMRGFTGNLFLCRSCEECSFKGVQRCSDLTLGDYWGIWDTHPQFDDNKGVSLVWIHSDTGRELWNQIRRELDYIPTSVEESIRENASAVNSAIAHERRQIFFDELARGTSVIPLVEACLTPPAKKNSLISRVLAKFKNCNLILK